jgi:hypothetical protein
MEPRTNRPNNMAITEKISKATMKAAPSDKALTMGGSDEP